ncbi:MAG: NAD(P)H-binding protein, partial [Actinomycetota bacterium]|nr:NAD(P)H-binding protein [Actinomycetota bacterium]
MSELFGVTGATGAVGGRVAELLVAADAERRLIVRAGSEADTGGAQVREIADYGDFDSMRAACDGVASLFLVSGREHPDRLQHHKTAVDAAVAAGVERIVYLSFLGAAPDATFTLARQHHATEAHVRGKGVAFTFLRSSLYLDF